MEYTNNAVFFFMITIVWEVIYSSHFVRKILCVEKFAGL